MKKILLFVIPLLALSLFSCNTKSNYPDVIVGSLEKGTMGDKYFVTPKGEILVASQGTAFMNLPEGLNRVWTELAYYIDESESANTAAEQKRVKVDGCYKRFDINKRPAERDAIAYNDPIQSLPTVIPGVGDFVPLSTRQNYLFVFMNHHFFLKNQESGSEKKYAQFDFSIEYDPELVQATSETAPDTINLYLKFYSNRAKEEKLYDEQRTTSAMVLDLVDLQNIFGIGSEEDFTYVLKLNYFSYDYESETSSTNEDKKSYKSALVKWKPNDQFKDIEWEK